eukprot:COSAG06_NODE_63932_length_261_cov_0.586420_1_plen_46_part_00
MAAPDPTVSSQTIEVAHADASQSDFVAEGASLGFSVPQKGTGYRI